MKQTQAYQWLAERGYQMYAVLLDGRSVPVSSPDVCVHDPSYSNDMIALPPGR